MEQHQFGLREWADLCERKDATIAALQARVKELEEWVQDQSTANLETMRHMDEMQSRAMDAESQLTQRTAELEAAKQHHEQSENAAQLYYRELARAKNRICEAAGLPPDSGYEPAIKHLQAELERVRGERDAAITLRDRWQSNLDEEESKSFMRNIEFVKLRTLIAALPKVEGEVEVYHHESGLRHSVVARPANTHYSSFDTPEEADSYAALLKHRQEMEG